MHCGHSRTLHFLHSYLIHLFQYSSQYLGPGCIIMFFVSCLDGVQCQLFSLKNLFLFQGCQKINIHSLSSHLVVFSLRSCPTPSPHLLVISDHSPTLLFACHHLSISLPGPSYTPHHLIMPCSFLIFSPSSP
jgi:hypothetical protein